MQEQKSAAAYQRQTVQLFTEATNGALAPHVILQDFAQATAVVGQTAVTTFIHTFFQHALADKCLTINNLRTEGKTVSLEMVITGRQTAPFWGLPNTGRHLQLPLTTICHFQADQITGIELHYDAGTLLRQLGLAL